MFLQCSKKQWIILGCILLTGLVVLGVVLGLVLTKSSEEDELKGGIVTNGYECAGIGRDILKKGGSAVDAAIAALFCEGVAMPQSTGIGGGFFMTIYIKETGLVETLNAREVAPLAATKDMYKDNPVESETGGKAVAVPGEVRGYEYAHKKYGKLPWSEIVQPTIDLCKRGHYVTEFLAKLFKDRSAFLKDEPNFKKIFVNSTTGEPYVEGEYVKRLKLAETLEVIAREGADALYNGSLTEQFVKDIQSFNGIITVEDMNVYKPIWEKPVKSKIFDDLTLYSFPLPGSGNILNFILNLIQDKVDRSGVDSVVTWQRIAESFKHGYGVRTQLGDPHFTNLNEILKDINSETYIKAIANKIKDDYTSQDANDYGANTTFVEDHGTAHISVLAPNGDAVAATGTINLIFGSKRMSPSTGIILNDEMDDFSNTVPNSDGLPPSPSNFIEPKKRPMSSMCPSIILNKNGTVRLIIGAAGGSKITSSVAEVIMKHLLMGLSLTEAIASPRMHHQLFPMRASFETKFPRNIVDGLQQIGHDCEISDTSGGFAAVTGAASYDGKMELVFDPRRKGSIAHLN